MCGEMPSKKPTDCCEDLKKFIKEDYYTACDSECDKRDMCCKGNCISKALKIVKPDGKFDKETAMKSMSDAFGAGSPWTAIYTKAVTDCESEGQFVISNNDF